MSEIKFTAKKDFRAYKAGDTRTIRLADNDVTFIVGNNGSGKSTLLHCIRAKKHTLFKINREERDGMSNNDDRILSDNSFCDIDGIDEFDNVFVLDSVDDNPLSLVNSSTASSFINGGGMLASRLSNGQKTIDMLNRFIVKIQNVTDFDGKKYNEGGQCPTRNLIIFDEVDEGLDIKWQYRFATVLKNMSVIFNASVVCVTHNVMLPFFLHGKDCNVYDIKEGDEVKLSEYVERETGFKL